MLTVKDICREIRAVFAIADSRGLEDAGETEKLFCGATRGNAHCTRHYLHNGKHAHIHGAVLNREKGYWEFTRIATWK